MAVDFGTTFLCVDDLADDMRLISGVAVVQQHVYHLLTTESLIDKEDFGIDLRKLLAAPITEKNVRVLGPTIDAIVQRDPRVETSTTTVTLDTSTNSPSLKVSVRAFTAAGPFDLVLGVSDVSVDLVQADPPFPSAPAFAGEITSGLT